MSAVPFLSRVLARAFPGLALRDLRLPAGPPLPWLSGVRMGVSGPLELDDAMLLRRLRQAGRPPLGLDPAADAGADPASDAAPERLVSREAPGEGGDATLTLVHGRLAGSSTPAGQVQLLLLLGSIEALECHELLMAEARLAALLDRPHCAGASFAGRDSWRSSRVVSPRLGIVFCQEPDRAVDSLVLDACSLPADLAPSGLPLLLGALPPRGWQLRLGFAGAPPGPVACFIDGRRLPARLDPEGHLVAKFIALARRAIILGLAWPGGAPRGLALGTLELPG